jgi:hypothetical protein
LILQTVTFMFRMRIMSRVLDLKKSNKNMIKKKIMFLNIECRKY